MRIIKNIFFTIFAMFVAMIFYVIIFVDNSKDREAVAEINRVIKKSLKINKLSPPLAYDGGINSVEITNYVVIFDDSGSMSGSKLSDAKKALKFFLDNLKPTDRVSMISLNSGMFKGKNDILQSYQNIEADGGTPLGRTLKKAKSYIDSIIKQNSGYGKYVIISISDGDATDVNDSQLQDILRSIYETKEADIILNCIGFHLSSNNNLNSPYTNYTTANSEEELKKLFSAILAEDSNFGGDVAEFK